MATFGKKSSGKKPWGSQAPAKRRLVQGGRGKFIGGKREVINPSEGDQRYTRHDSDERYIMVKAQGETMLYVTRHQGEIVTHTLPKKQDAAFSHDVFSSQAEYDRSVDSVVARIKSGEVQARQPDRD